MSALRDRLIPRTEQSSLEQATTNIAAQRTTNGLARVGVFNETYGLPQGWNSFIDRYGRTYYCNFNTNVTQFENPMTNMIEKSQHNNPVLPSIPPHIDELTPYYLWNVAPSNSTQPQQYWYEDEEMQPPYVPDPTTQISEIYHHTVSHQQFQQFSPDLTSQQLHTVPLRPLREIYQERHTFCQSIAWVANTHIFLMFLFVVMVFCFSSAVWWGVVQFMGEEHFIWSKITGPPQFAGFCIAYLLYFILYIAPTVPFCCFPCLDCGWAGPCVSLDIMTPLKARFNNRTLTQSEIVDKIEQMQRDVPVLAVISESYHYPSEDCAYDANELHSSDYAAYEVSKHGLNSQQAQNTPSSTEGWFNKPQSNEPILSQRIRRPIPVIRFRDISTPISTLTDSNRLLATHDNPYGIVNIRYTSRFELHPLQLPMMESLLKQHYYHAYTSDLHTDSHIEYSIGSESELYLQKSYQDVMFTNNHETRQVRKQRKYGRGETKVKRNASFCFICCFEWNLWFIALWAGFYCVVLFLWRWSAITYTYHNVKYLHIAPFQTVQAPPISSLSLDVGSPSQPNDGRRPSSSSSSSALLFTQPPAGSSDYDGPRRYQVVDQTLFRGKRARTAGSRPIHHQFRNYQGEIVVPASPYAPPPTVPIIDNDHHTITLNQSDHYASNRSTPHHFQSGSIQPTPTSTPTSTPAHSRLQRPDSASGKKQRPSVMNQLQQAQPSSRAPDNTHNTSNQDSTNNNNNNHSNPSQPDDHSISQYQPPVHTPPNSTHSTPSSQSRRLPPPPKHHHAE